MYLYLLSLASAPPPPLVYNNSKEVADVNKMFLATLAVEQVRYKIVKELMFVYIL